jgi:hypothetical protein
LIFAFIGGNNGLLTRKGYVKMNKLQELQNQIDSMYGVARKKESDMDTIQQTALNIFNEASSILRNRMVMCLKREYGIVFDQKYIENAPDSELVYNYKQVRKHIKEVKNKPERYIYYWGLNIGNGVMFAIHREA